MQKLYYKDGRSKRYKELPYPSDYQGFPTDGVWLVQGRPNVQSSSCILKIGELPALYPFANMVVARDDLATFICKWYATQKYNQPRYDKNGDLTSFAVKSYHDLATDILKFLSELDKNGGGLQNAPKT